MRGGLRRWVRTGSVLGLAVACAVLWSAPLASTAAAAPESEPERSSPADLVVDGGEVPVGVPGLPTADLDGVTRDRSDVPKVDPDATRGREVVEDRSERTRVWERSDGLLEAELSTDPVAFRAWDQSMRLIDPSVHVSPDRPGWLVTGANSWSASFGPSDAGVSVTLPSGRSFWSRPAAFDGTAPARVVAPVRDRDDESVVWYRQVWPVWIFATR